MKSVTAFVPRENITRYAAEYERELDPQRRHTVRTLLLEEESRYGFRLAQLETANGALATIEQHLERQKALVKRLPTEGKADQQALQCLDNLITLHALLADFRALVVEQSDRSQAVLASASPNLSSTRLS